MQRELRLSGKPLLTFKNAGNSRFLNMDFWRSRYARYGFPYLSVCDDVLRLLVPSHRLDTWLPGILAGKRLIIVSPAHTGNLEYTELIFDDDSPFPFRIMLDVGAGQQDPLPEAPLCCIVYGAGRVIVKLPCESGMIKY